MSGCCENGCELNALHGRQRTTLKIVLSINASMFFVVVAAALYAGSVALMSDILDNLGDAITYALSIYAVSKGRLVKARVAMFKGVLILAGALVVAAQIIYKLMHPSVPIFETMGAFSLLGLVEIGVWIADSGWPVIPASVST